MTPEAMADLANRVLFADWQRREAEVMCQSKGTTFGAVLHEATVARALESWAFAVKVFVYKCVTPSGQTNKCFSYATSGPDGGLVCAFCGRKPTESRSDVSHD